MKIKKLGFVYKPDGSVTAWNSHCMAPSPIKYSDEVIRVFMGGWSESGISSIYYLDIDIANPLNVLGISQRAILGSGRDGCFDENGVFPGHAFDIGNGLIYLYYTGFQLGHKIRHYNFGGLAISEDGGDTFKRYSEAPVMDRADEGLFVRAGQSIERSDEGGFHMLYSAGSSWHMCNGEMRPVYDIYYQATRDGIAIEKHGDRILSCDLSIEHGLGRPQIIKLGEYFYAFYTRRIIKDMKYYIGAARSKDCRMWNRVDDMFDGIDQV